MISAEMLQLLEFIKGTEKLKNTLRSGHTSNGRKESVPDHTWRLCLMAVLFHPHFPEINFEKLIKICLLHDLGEAIHGDIPAPNQVGAVPKTDQERMDFESMIEPLPEPVRSEFLNLWEDYEHAISNEAKLAKALDKMETIIQHNQGDNPDDFDFTFNLNYGRKYTDYNKEIKAFRAYLDVETLKNAELKKSDK